MSIHVCHCFWRDDIKVATNYKFLFFTLDRLRVNRSISLCWQTKKTEKNGFHLIRCVFDLFQVQINCSNCLNITFVKFSSFFRLRRVAVLLSLMLFSFSYSFILNRLNKSYNTETHVGSVYSLKSRTHYLANA